MKTALRFGLVVLGCTGTALARGTSIDLGYYLASSAATGSAHGTAQQGYLGVDVRDVSEDRLAVLKLKDAHGAEITLVDHDAPAGKADLREHDVVLLMNGQPVDGEEQIRRMLRESPPGKAIVLVISRDGRQITVTTQMANREEVERQAWVKHFTVPEPQVTSESSVPAYAPAPAAPAVHGGNSFMGTILMSPAYTGAMLEQMSAQLASFFGVAGGSGLLVRSVAANSPAEAAGMHAGDVVVRADAKAVMTTSDWAKAIKNSRGRSLAVTVLRDKKEQTLTLTPDGKKRSSLEELIVQPERTMMAFLSFSWISRQ